MSANEVNNGPRVLLIAPQPFFSNRGTPINVRALAETLGQRGVLVDLLVYPFGSDLHIPNVNIIRTNKFPGIRSVPIGPSWRKAFLDIMILYSAWRLIRSRKYAAVHGIEEAAIIAYFLKKIYGVPYVFDMDSHIVDQLQTSGFITISPLLRVCSKLEELALRNSKAILTVCSELSNVARGIAADIPIYQIEDFANEDQLRVLPAVVGRIRDKFLVPGEKVILYTGNFESYQGIDLLIDAFAIAARSSNSRLLLVGGKPTDIQLYKEKVAALGLTDQVTFAGECPGEEIGSFLSVADALVSPRCVGCNTPLKVYSYMAVGKPIVATRILSHTQVLTVDNAYLTETTAESFANGLLQALDDSVEATGERVAKCSQAKQLAASRFSRAHFDAELNKLYDFLLGVEPSENRRLAHG